MFFPYTNPRQNVLRTAVQVCFLHQAFAAVYTYNILLTSKKSEYNNIVNVQIGNIEKSLTAKHNNPVTRVVTIVLISAACLPPFDLTEHIPLLNRFVGDVDSEHFDT